MMQKLDSVFLAIALMATSSILIFYSKAGMAQEPEIRFTNNISPQETHTQKQLVVVYDQEVDIAIEQYFQSVETQEIETFNPNKNNVSPTDKFIDKPEVSDKSGSKPRKATTHIVQTGDSIWEIARDHGLSLDTLYSANPGKKNKPIFVGEKLVIPAEDGISYKVRSGDSLSLIAKKYKVKVQAIQDKNNIVGSLLKPGDMLFLPGATAPKVTKYIQRKMFMMPVSGRISSQYGFRIHPVTGRRAFHAGIDIAAPAGTAIKAAAAGRVVFSANSGGYGKMVILKHKYGYHSIYAHARKLTVKRGQHVVKGQKIAEIGDTGMATGNHLHFEIKRKSKKINPLVALKKKIKVAVKE